MRPRLFSTLFKEGFEIGQPMITREFADRFAEEWIASWNSHDLTRILSHYTDAFEMTSPYIVQIAGESSGVLKGKEAVAAYWAKALERMPTLHFELHSTLVGTESLVIYYRGVRGMAAELFFFDTQGKVTQSYAHYM
jgi:SnoaL-like domain